MPRPEKVAVVDEIRTKLAEADATVLTEYRGLTVHELAELRGVAAQSGTEYKVFKNTLARRAVEGAGPRGHHVDVRRTGGDRVRAGATPPPRPRRSATSGRTTRRSILKGGLLGTRVITPADIDALAELPSREILLSQIAGTFQAPLVKAAGLFQAFTAQLRLRRPGADRPAHRRRRAAPAAVRRGGRRRRPKPTAEADAPVAAATRATAEAPPRRRPKPRRPKPEAPSRAPSPHRVRVTRVRVTGEKSIPWQP